MIIVVPILTMLFGYAGAQAWRTHRGFSFDSNVLFLCAIYNAVFFLTNMVRCTAVAQYIDFMLVTAIILYLYYNFESVLREMGNEQLQLKKKHRLNSVAFRSATSIIANRI